MFRADSERSLCDSDENVMEGGVTIKQRVDQRQPVSHAPVIVAVVVSGTAMPVLTENEMVQYYM